MQLRGRRTHITQSSREELNDASGQHTEAPARGIIWGLLISLLAFWAPLAIGLIYLLSRS